jgi:glycosyltransferase involved in cell wall biosynthesis
MDQTLDEPSHGCSVSIVMPVLNGMPWIHEAVTSVVAQKGVEIELIILDGGSTDGTREWLKGSAPPGARVLLEADRGQADAIAKGLALAKGSILGWLNADDVLEPGALAAACEVFASHPGASMVSGACLLIDELGAITGRIETPPDGSLGGLLRHPQNLAQPSTFFSAEAFRATAGLDRRLHYAMDVDLWLKLARVAPAALMPDRVLARFRIHAAAKSTRAATAMVREDLRVRLRHGMPVLSRTSLALLRRAYARPIAYTLGIRSRRDRG